MRSVDWIDGLVDSQTHTGMEKCFVLSQHGLIPNELAMLLFVAEIL